MEWIKITEKTQLPLEGQFLAIWKGRICIVEYDEDLDRFEICFEPAQTGTYRIEPEGWAKFYYWMPLPDFPQEWKDIK